MSMRGVLATASWLACKAIVQLRVQVASEEPIEEADRRSPHEVPRLARVPRVDVGEQESESLAVVGTRGELKDGNEATPEEAGGQPGSTGIGSVAHGRKLLVGD